MQGNDIGGWHGKRQVVVMEPLLISPPETLTGRAAAKLLGRAKEAEQWKLNTLMCQWIVDMGYRFNMPTEVWSFLPERLFNQLMPRINRICGDYIVEWNRWAALSEAYTVLRATTDIVTVYDADEDRVERFWHFRGTRVPQGGIPR